MGKQTTPNDQRSDVKNPTSPEYEADLANRVNLGHPNVPPPPAPSPQGSPAVTPKKG